MTPETIIETGDGQALVVSREPRSSFLWIGIATSPDEPPDVVIRLNPEDTDQLHRAVREHQRPGVHRWPHLFNRVNLRVGAWITWGKRGLVGEVREVLVAGKKWRVAYQPPGCAATTVVLDVRDKPRRVRREEGSRKDRGTNKEGRGHDE